MEMKWALASYLAQTTTARAVNGLLSIDLEEVSHPTVQTIHVALSFGGYTV